MSTHTATSNSFIHHQPTLVLVSINKRRDNNDDYGADAMTTMWAPGGRRINTYMALPQAKMFDSALACDVNSTNTTNLEWFTLYRQWYELYTLRRWPEREDLPLWEKEENFIQDVWAIDGGSWQQAI